MPSHSRLISKQEKALKKSGKNYLQGPLYEPESVDRTEKIPVALSPKEHSVVLKLSYQNNQLVSFFIGYFQQRNDKSVEIYSVDTSHGWFHEHVLGHRRKNDRKNIRPLFSQVDVQESYDEGYSKVLDKYERATGGRIR